MKLSKIAFIDKLPFDSITEGQIQIIKDALPGTEVMVVKSVADLKSKTDDVDAIFTMPGDLGELYEFCKTAPSIKWIQSLLSGTDMLDNTPLSTLPGLTITATRGNHAEPMSNHALAFIFAFLRNLPDAFEMQRDHKWPRMGEDARMSDVTAFKTVGIIGSGSIGTGVAEKCKILGMSTLGLRRNPVPCEWFDEVYSADRLDEMLPKCDFVVITAPLTEETRGMIGKRQLELMKKTAVVINLARGAIIDQTALIKALKNGDIGGTGIDATDPEPLPPDSELWDCPNTIITPHRSAQSPYVFEASIRILAENCKRYIAGEELQFIYKKG